MITITLLDAERAQHVAELVRQPCDVREGELALLPSGVLPDKRGAVLLASPIVHNIRTEIERLGNAPAERRAELVVSFMTRPDEESETVFMDDSCFSSI